MKQIAQTSTFLSFACLGACLANSAAAQLPFTLSADDMAYDDKNQTVTATGNVRIEAETGMVQADKVFFNQATDTVTAEGNVVYVDKRNVAIFTDRLELDGDLKSAAINSLKVRIGKEGPALAADKAEKTEDRYLKLHNAVYSPCKLCVDENSGKTSAPVWQIRAKEITYDKQQKNVSYESTYLDVYGVPVVYLPYFKHPIGEQVKQSGLLPPKFGRSTNRGEEVTLSYYFAHDDHNDTTLRTRFMSRRGLQAIAEHRSIGKKTEGELRGSIISDSKSSTVRSHIEGSVEYVAEQGMRLGINGKAASDDTYLDDFFGDNPSFLPTKIYAEKASENSYLALHGTWYQDLRDGKDPAQTAQLVPRMQAEKIYKMGGKGGRLNLSGDVLTLHRGEGVRSRRIVTQAHYSKPFMTKDGQNLKLGARLRADGYHVDGNNNGNNNGFTGRVFPEISAVWEKPYVSPGGNHKISPKAMLIAAPRGGNPDDIPNEDSVAYELDTTNLFDENRFAGFDRLESGPRVVYGLDNYFGNASDARWRVFFGQTHRFYEENTLPSLGGTATKSSDWVGLVQTAPAPWFSLSNRFRLDNSDFSAKRLDTEMRVGELNKTNLTITHTFLDGGPEEATFKAQYDLTDEISLYAQSRQDLTEGGKQLLSEGRFVYTHNCYRFSFTARRRGFNNRNVPPSTDFLFNIELLTLGRDGKHIE